MDWRLRVVTGVAAFIVVAGTGTAALVAHSRDLLPSMGLSPAVERFPNIDRSALTATQVRVLDVAKAQFDTQPAALTFSEGVEEPWCADFVSWVMAQAGAPLHNPNSGSWRIPGVYTMQEYFTAAGRFSPGPTTPQPGDVVLWGPGSPMGLHANIVVAVEGADVTTVGGNEGGIHVRRAAIGPDSHLLGYGRLG